MWIFKFWIFFLNLSIFIDKKGEELTTNEMSIQDMQPDPNLFSKPIDHSILQVLQNLRIKNVLAATVERV